MLPKTIQKMKKYRISFNVGKAKYVVSYHDGEKRHKDGSAFFDISIFKNKKKMGDFISELQEKGFVEL